MVLRSADMTGSKAAAALTFSSVESTALGADPEMIPTIVGKGRESRWTLAQFVVDAAIRDGEAGERVGFDVQLAWNPFGGKSISRHLEAEAEQALVIQFVQRIVVQNRNQRSVVRDEVEVKAF